MLKLYTSASQKICKSVVKNEEGAALIEYVLIASLISIVAITIMQQVGGKVVTAFQAVFDALP